MKIVKVIVAIFLSIVLLLTSGLTLGSYAMSEAISEEAIEDAIVETGAVDQLTDHILQETTSNHGGSWGDTMQLILKSDSMTDFFSAYTAKCLQGIIYGEEYEEIGADEINVAFQNGIDECIANGSIGMNEFERKAFDTELNYAMPTLTKGINYVMQEMNLDSYIDSTTTQNIEFAQKLIRPEVRYSAMVISIILCLLLIILFWKSKLGVIWCGVVILIVAACFELAGLILDGTAQSSGGDIVLSTKMLYIMIAFGLQKIAIFGGIVGAGVIGILFPILRKIF